MTYPKTVSDKLAALNAPKPEGKTRTDWLREIFAELPGDMPAPVVSNEGERAFFNHPGAWLSWSPSYGDTWTGLDMLRRLEASGFEWAQASLVKWDNYRRHPEPGLCRDLPEEKGGRLRYKLTDCEAMLPLWMTASNFRDCEAHAFYHSPRGLLLKVNVRGPWPFRVNARKEEFRGGWRYERGTARLHYPNAWEAVAVDGETLAERSAHTAAHCDTDQGLSGEIYWTPNVEPDDWKPSPAAILSQLAEVA